MLLSFIARSPREMSKVSLRNHKADERQEGQPSPFRIKPVPFELSEKKNYQKKKTTPVNLWKI